MADPYKHAPSLRDCVGAVEERVVRTVMDAGLPDDLATLLLSGAEARKGKGALGHPVAPFYLTIRAHAVAVDPHAQAIGAAFVLLHRALSVLDDVQDGDLEGPLGECGDAVAINCGIGLLFLAIDGLWQVAREVGGVRGGRIHHLLRVHTLRFGIGQHRDLTGRGRRATPAHALATAIDKSAIFALLTELAGVCACGETNAPLPKGYRVIGDAMAEIHQLANDVFDLFSGANVDIRTDTWNVPLAVMLDTLPERERATRAEALRAADPADVRRQVYESGALGRVAQLMDDARGRVHTAFAALPCEGPYLAFMLAWVDARVSGFYLPPALTTATDIDAAFPDGLEEVDATLLRRLQRARARAGPAKAGPLRLAKNLIPTDG